MRLIDIEAFYKFCDQSLKSGHEVYPEYYDDYLGTDMFTVKAVPVEWIKNIINVNLYLWEQTKDRMFIDQGVVKVVNYSMTAQILSELIDRWEQENEKDI